MEASVQLARATCTVLRGLDYDAQLCVRGSLLLGQMLRHAGSPARKAALEAGAPLVLLSVLETQVRGPRRRAPAHMRPACPRGPLLQARNAEVVTTVLRVLLVVGSNDAGAVQVRMNR